MGSRPPWERHLSDDALHEMGKPPGDNNDFGDRPVIVVTYSGDDEGFWMAYFGTDAAAAMDRQQWVTGSDPMDALRTLLGVMVFSCSEQWAHEALRRQGRLHQ